MTGHVSLDFDADARQLASVRDFARSHAEALDVPVDLELLAVVVGELAANAAVHQQGRARLDLDLLDDGTVEVSVFDPSSQMPRLIADDPWSPDGHRGIQLVAALAQSWGVEQAPAGKRVWARLHPEDAPSR